MMSRFLLALCVFGVAFAGEEEDNQKQMMCFSTTVVDSIGKGKACDLSKIQDEVQDLLKNIMEAAKDEDLDEMKNILSGYMGKSMNAGFCMFQKAAEKCGSMVNNTAILKEFAKQQRETSCGGGMKDKSPMAPWCVGKSEMDRTELTKGFFCAIENPSMGTYVRQCYSALMEDWDAMQASSGMKTALEVKCGSSSDQNQCSTFYGAIKDQCGADVAKKNYKLITKSICGSQQAPPEKLFFDYDPNVAGYLLPLTALTWVAAGIVAFV